MDTDPTPAHVHKVSARIIRDGGEAVCVECGVWIWVDPETAIAVERILVPEQSEPNYPPRVVDEELGEHCPCGQGEPHAMMPYNPLWRFDGGDDCKYRKYLLDAGWCPQCGHMAVRDLGTLYACGHGHQWDTAKE